MSATGNQSDAVPTENFEARRVAAFVTTDWSEVPKAGRPDTPTAPRALELLCFHVHTPPLWRHSWAAGEWNHLA